MKIPSLLLRHQDFIVINKPAGVSVQQNVCEIHFVNETAKLFGIPRLWLVHRLDKETSGVLILACSAQSASVLGRMFAEHRVEKTYLALSDVKPSKKQGWVKGGMAKSRNGCWKLTRKYDNRAVTQFQTASLEPPIRLFVLKPKTGRTHQLRVAMKSLGSPSWAIGVMAEGMQTGCFCMLGVWYLSMEGRNFVLKLRLVQIGC